MTLSAYRVTVEPGWVDYNLHLNEGYYGVVFADAGDHVLVQLGFGPDYRSRVGGTFYTAETHTRFLAEVPADSRVIVRPSIVGVDDKRLHLYHEMCVEGAEDVVATQESMQLHVDIATGRVSTMAAELRATALALVSADAPEDLGRSVRRIG
jgi:acyl-CoA thioester hydrolase